MAVDSPARVRPLAEYVANSLPAVVDSPGATIRYSNQGYAVAGRAVEVASGTPYAAYVEQRIFGPLAMSYSYVAPHVPSANHATPYRYRSDTVAEPGIFEHGAPGGAVRSTATDLARLVAALLDSTTGLPLSASSKRLILSAQEQPASLVAGYAYGTFEYPNNHVRAVSVGGEVPGFSARVLMVPGLQLGVVLLVNRKDPTLAISVFDSVLSRLPSIPPAQERSAPADKRVALARNLHIDGRYRSNVYEHESFLRIAALFGPMLSVTQNNDGTLHVVNPVDNTAGR